MANVVTVLEHARDSLDISAKIILVAWEIWHVKVPTSPQYYEGVMVTMPVSMRGQMKGSLERSLTPALENALVMTLPDIMALLTQLRRHAMVFLVAKKLHIMVLLTRFHRHAMQ